MAKKSRAPELLPADMTPDQAACYAMLCDLFGGEHHLYGAVRACGSTGIDIHVPDHAPATYDFDLLTRAVVFAHDRGIRFAIASSRPGHLRLFLHKRARQGALSQRHPTLDEAVSAVRANWPQPEEA